MIIIFYKNRKHTQKTPAKSVLTTLTGRVHFLVKKKFGHAQIWIAPHNPTCLFDTFITTYISVDLIQPVFIHIFEFV